MQHLQLEADESLMLPDPRWRQITADCVELGYRYQEVMCQMNRSVYASEPAEVVVCRMIKPPCSYFYLNGGDHEVVAGYKWIERRRQYRLMSTGFAGCIGPRGALNLVVDLSCWFARVKGISRIVAIRPHQMESPLIIQFYDLLWSYPGLRVRGTHRVREGTYLWLELSPESDLP